MSSGVDVSVVVCVFNEERRLQSCLEGLSRQTYPRDRYDVVVIDDESTDRSPEIAGSFEKRAVHLAADDIKESIAELRHYRERFLRV